MGTSGLHGVQPMSLCWQNEMNEYMYCDRIGLAFNLVIFLYSKTAAIYNTIPKT